MELQEEGLDAGNSRIKTNGGARLGEILPLPTLLFAYQAR